MHWAGYSLISGGGLGWWIGMVVVKWPYYKWYHSLSSKILSNFYVKNIFLAQKLTKLEQFKENLSKFQHEIVFYLNGQLVQNCK